MIFTIEDPLAELAKISLQWNFLDLKYLQNLGKKIAIDLTFHIAYISHGKTCLWWCALSFVLGLSLTLYINQAEYIGALTQSAGIVLAVHDVNTYPFISDGGIDIGVGQQMDVKVTTVWCLRDWLAQVKNAMN